MFHFITRYFITFISIFCISKAYAQQFCRTPDRNNFIAAKPVADQPNLKWRFKTNGEIFASPIVSGELLLTGSCDSSFYALNKKTGAIAWTFKTHGQIRSSAAVENNTVVFLSTDGILYALDLVSGKLKWKFTTSGEKFYDTWDYYQSSPAVQLGIAYFGCGDGNVYAVKMDSGKLLWKFKTNGIVHASPALATNTVLIGSYDGFFYCLDRNGKLKWKFKTLGEHNFPNGEIQFNAAISDSTVYFCARDYNVYALKISTGSGHWVYHQQGSWTNVPSISANKLLVTSSDVHHVLGLEKTYGTILYEAPVHLNVFSSAAINDSIAYIGAINGALYKLNTHSGSIITIFQTEAGKAGYSNFFKANGQPRMDVANNIYNGDIHLFYTALLKIGGIYSTVWIDDGVLYFGSSDQCIYAIE